MEFGRGFCRVWLRITCWELIAHLLSDLECFRIGHPFVSNLRLALEILAGRRDVARRAGRHHALCGRVVTRAMADLWQATRLGYLPGIRYGAVDLQLASAGHWRRFWFDVSGAEMHCGRVVLPCTLSGGVFDWPPSIAFLGSRWISETRCGGLGGLCWVTEFVAGWVAAFAAEAR